MLLSKWGFVSIILWSQFLWARSSSENFEEKMYNIYKSSYSHEVADDFWSQYVNSAGTRSYQVVKGDNLWSLSEVFFGDGHYWSKIWSYNEKLTNPHLILVGQKILFFTGSIEEPPHLSIKNQEGSQPSDEGKDLSNGDNQSGGEKVSDEKQSPDGKQESMPKDQIATTSMPQVSLPPPQKGIVPVQPIPPAFKDTRPKRINDDEIKVKMDMHTSDHMLSILVEAFLYDKGAGDYPKKIGRVLESEESKVLLSINEFIYIESKEDLNIGEELTVMDENYVIKGLFLSFGSVISYLGRIKITHPLGDHRYRAEVIQSHNEIKSGAWISRENIPSFSNDYKGQYSNQEVEVVGGGTSEEINIFSQNDTIFLNGGSQQGLRKGDILGIYSKRSKRYKNTSVKISPIPIAHIKIFNTSETVASAFVLNSSEAILVGDKTGNPTFVARVDPKDSLQPEDSGVEEALEETGETQTQ